MKEYTNNDAGNEILKAANCPSGYILPCIIGIGYAAENAEYPAQTYPKFDECVHWNKMKLKRPA